MSTELEKQLAQLKQDLANRRAEAEGTTVTAIGVAQDPSAPFTPDEKLEFEKNMQADLALDQAIRHFETVNNGLFEAVDDAGIFRPVVRQNTSKTEQPHTLR